MKTITQIKEEFKSNNIDLILIEDGGFFIGSWEQLDDCFALYPNELKSFCEDNNLKYEIILASTS